MLIGLMAQKSPVFVNFVINSIKKIKFKQNFENFVPLCLPNLSTISDKILFNNANWCLGELSIIVPHSVEICINVLLFS